MDNYVALRFNCISVIPPMFDVHVQATHEKDEREKAGEPSNRTMLLRGKISIFRDIRKISKSDY